MSSMSSGASRPWLSKFANALQRARALLLYLSFSSASNFVGLATTLFMIRHVAPDQFGRLAISLGALLVANAVIGFGADNLVAINKTKLSAEDYGQFRASYSDFALMSYAVAQIVVVPVWLSGWADALILLVPLMALVKFFVSMASIEYVMEQRAVAYGLVQFLTTVVAALVTVGLVLWVSPRAESRIAALLLADITLLMVRFGFHPGRLLQWRFRSAEFSGIVRFGAPLMLSIGPAYAINEMDKVIVAQQLDLAAAGVYGAGSTIAGFMLTFITALLNTASPQILTALKQGDTPPLAIARRYALRFCGLSLAFAALFLLVYTVVAPHLLPSRYADAISVVYALVLMMQARSFYAVVGTVTDFFGMSKEKLMGFVIATVVSLGAVLLLVPTFGLIGATAGPGLGYACLGAWLMFSLHRKKPDIDNIEKDD